MIDLRQPIPEQRTDIRPALVVSFHDLAPHTRDLCDYFLKRLRTFGVSTVSLLVVPQWYAGRRLRRDSPFVYWLQQRADEGHEICLHGLFHRAENIHGGPWSRFVGRVYTNAEGEFYQLGAEEARRRLDLGMEILHSLPLVPEGFVPPAWLMPPELRPVVRHAGFKYTTLLTHIDWLEMGRRIPAPVVTFSNRAAWRRAASRCWVHGWSRSNRHQPILRLAVHPGDLVYPELEYTLFALLRRQMEYRTPATYRDLLKLLALREAARS